MCSCSLSSTCACSRPCLLLVPMLCVPVLRVFVLGVCPAFVYIVRPSPVNVVDITGVRRPVLRAGVVHACVLCACASHARVACTCCACVLCMLSLCALALPMLALRAPAVRALVVRVRAGRLRAGCGVLVQHSLTSCGARRRHRHHIPRRPDMPLPIHIVLAWRAHAYVPCPHAAYYLLACLVVP